MNIRPRWFLTLAIALLLSGGARADLTIQNGNFDVDPVLGGGDDPDLAPTNWFTHYTGAATWADFRFGNDGNGAWDDNGIAFGQTFLPPDFPPGPGDGYYYTSLGHYNGELTLDIIGFGYNRVNGNPAGEFEVGVYFSPGATFAGADGTDVAGGSTVPLGSQIVDISALTGNVAQSQFFDVPFVLAGSGIEVGDEVWLRLGDGPDDLATGIFDEPIIDNLQAFTTIPEPSSLACLLMGLGVAAVAAMGRRRRSNG